MPPATKTFTARQLRRFTGGRGGPIYVAVKGVVYDVSDAREFYGSGSPYEVFAGHECARALASLTLDEENLTDNLVGLEEEEKAALEEWVAKFRRQYRVAGKVDETKKSPIRRCLPIIGVAVAIAGIILHKK